MNQSIIESVGPHVNYTLVLSDAGKTITTSSASANTLTVPPDSQANFSPGTVIVVEQHGAGATTLTAGVGVTIRSRGALLAMGGQYAVASIRKIGTNEWLAAGDLA
jgi:hypothetical protein